MDFLSHCRRCCLQCLPFLHVSPVSAPKAPPSPHPAELPRSSPVAPPQAQAPASANKSQDSRTLQSTSDESTGPAKPAALDIGGKPAPEGDVAVPVSVSSSSPSRKSGAYLQEPSKPSVGTEHALNQGISRHRRSNAVENLSQEGLANVGNADASETSISPPVLDKEIVYREGNDNESSAMAGDSISIEAGNADENLLQKGSANVDNADASETSISLPVLDKEIVYREGNDNESPAMAGDSASVEAYSSESVPSEVSEDYKEEISPNSSHGGRRRLRDRLKNPFKSISKSSKRGLHLKEEGEKHKQTVGGSPHSYMSE